MFDQYYSFLAGSHGEIGLHLPNHLLRKLCDLLTPALRNNVKEFDVFSSGHNRFRIRTELPSGFANWLGSAFFNILSDNGIEILIHHRVATPGSPFRGTLTTNFVGKTVIPRIVKSINQGLGVGNILTMRSEFLSDETEITFDPFPLLRQHLPAGVRDHVESIQWTTNDDSFFLKFLLRHTGVKS